MVDLHEWYKEHIRMTFLGNKSFLSTDGGKTTIEVLNGEMHEIIEKAIHRAVEAGEIGPRVRPS